MELDVQILRSLTPGVRDDVVFLGSAGSALSSAKVVGTVKEYLDIEAALGGYEAYAAEQQRFLEARDTLAALIGGTSEQLALLPSGTVAWHRVLAALALGEGDRVLMPESEYAGNVLPLLQLAQRVGIVVEFLPLTDDQLDLDVLHDRLGSDVKLVVVSHVASHRGQVHDVAAIGRVIGEASPDTYYVVDACQSVGQLPIDVSSFECDALTGTGRKWLRGPRGSGFLHVGERLLETTPAVLDHMTGEWQSGDEVRPRPGVQRFAMWEQSWAAQAGLGAATAELFDLVPPLVHQRIWHLAELLRDRLRAIPGVRVHDQAHAKSGIVSFSHASVPSEHIVAGLRGRQVIVGLAPPEVARRDFYRMGVGPLVRCATQIYNTEDEIERAGDALAAVLTAAP